MDATFILKGLDCPNCSATIEKEVRELDGVSSSSVNLMSQTLAVSFSAQQSGSLLKTVEKIVHAHEPDVEVSLKPAERSKAASLSNDGNASRNTVMKIGIGAVIYAAGLALPYVVGVDPTTELGILIVAYLVLGGEVVLKALRNIARGRIFDENFLMSVSTIGAFVIGEYPEAVAVMLFYQVGEFFQSYAVRRSRRSIADLMDIRPDTANVKRDGRLVEVSPEDIRIGEIITVKPGERIPLDGLVVEGSSFLDAKALTGESIPRRADVGDTVLSGCVNQNGLLDVEVRKTFEESTATKIIDLVENAASRKAPTENFITTFSRYYTPMVVGLAAMLAIVPPLVLGGDWADWVHRGFVFLVISCPCALVISIPLGFFGGIGGASRKGVLVKGSNYLEALSMVDTVVFDKTGTLTKGVFKVREVTVAGGHTEAEVLALAARAEAFSNHPIAASLREAYGKPVGENPLDDYEEIAGRGVSMTEAGEEVVVGSDRLMSDKGIAVASSTDEGTRLYVARNGSLVGCITISDEVKEDSAATVAGLKELGVRKTAMLTGDARRIGEHVAAELGIDEVYTELLPGDKVEKVEALDSQKAPGRKLAFVGDGMNDAPVLARADVGIAMGGLGSDAAIEAADVVLMTDEPSKLLDAIIVARATKRIVLQNIVFALGIKGVFLILGALGIAGMWEAVFADMGVTMIAILNAMRAMRVKGATEAMETA